MSKKLVVLISGQGSNLQAILDACANGELAAEVTAVISNNPDAKGLERAQKFGVPTLVKSKLPAQTRTDYDRELADLVREFNPDWIVLAGWMRLLTTEFLQQFPNQVINLHPALPGAFPGVNAIERAFAAYKNNEIHETGVMVHLVPDEGVDSGPVLAQVKIAFDPTEDLAQFAQRVHQIEHKLLITTLKNLKKL